MELTIMIQGVNDPPRLKDIPQPIHDFSDVDSITLCVLESGMSSGDPSVMIVSKTNQGSIILATSLDKFLAGATGMAAAAETHWGWTIPEGYATILPPDKETRKALLESIKKELEEWDEVEDG